MKINHEEHKALKELDDELKWIARDEPGELYVYDEKPIKLEIMWSYTGLHMEWIREHEHLFHFIQWEDEEPYNIQELISDYEYKTGTFDWATAFQSALHGESEETEVKKDREFLRSMIQRRIDNLPTTYIGRYTEGSRDAYELVLQDINELDEPEVLSVEVEQKYNVQLKVRSSSGAVGVFLYKQGDEVLAGDNFKAYRPEEDKFRLTEQEIKDFDPRYMTFTIPVEEDNND